MLFYYLTALVISFFICPINLLFIFVIENFLGYDNKVYAEYLVGRIENREQFWVPDRLPPNLELDPKARSMDNYCFHSQYFFILSMFGMGGVFLLMGITTYLNQNYNPFLDAYTPVIMVFWVVLCLALDWMVRRLAICCNLWDYQRYQAEDAEPPASHSPGHVDESQQGLRLDAINRVLAMKDTEDRIIEITKVLDNFYKDEEFKVQFVKENRAWILENLE